MSETPRDQMVPIVLDLGKVKRKQVKKLKQGIGPLLGEVHEAIASVHQELAAEADGKVLVPVVLLYERKRKKRRGWLVW